LSCFEGTHILTQAREMAGAFGLNQVTALRAARKMFVAWTLRGSSRCTFGKKSFRACV
jgi:hypothetical protein